MRLRIAVLCFLTALSLAAQAPSPDAWKTSETLGDVDLSGLTPVQKKAVLKILREEDCSCQCGMKTAESRHRMRSKRVIMKVCDSA